MLGAVLALTHAPPLTSAILLRARGNRGREAAPLPLSEPATQPGRGRGPQDGASEPSARTSPAPPRSHEPGQPWAHETETLPSLPHGPPPARQPLGLLLL